MYRIIKSMESLQKGVRSKEIVVILVKAEHCYPCRRQLKLLNLYEAYFRQSFSFVRIFQIYYNDFLKLLRELRVIGGPSLLFYVNGVYHHHCSGMQSFNEVNQELLQISLESNHVPTPNMDGVDFDQIEYAAQHLQI